MTLRFVFLFLKGFPLTVLSSFSTSLHSPDQCLCHSGGGGLYRAGALPGVHPGHAGVRFQQVPAQKSAYSL